MHRSTGPGLVRGWRVHRAMAGEVPGRPGWQDDLDRGPERDPDRRACARRAPRRHDPDRATHSRQRVVRGNGRARSPRGGEDLLRARRRAHPVRRRPPAVRARPAVPRRQLAPARCDGHGVYRRAQHHSRGRDAWLGARAAGAHRGDHRAQRDVRCGGDPARCARSPGTRHAGRPWIVAFVFGLLHGFGFAGALQQVGLPEKDIPIALLFFNVGVEVGQLLFIAAVVAVLSVLTRLFRRRGTTEHGPWHSEAMIRTPVAYMVGSVAAFWVVQRVVAFWP